MSRLIHVLALAFAASNLAQAAGPVVRRANSVERIVRFEFVVVNKLDRPQEISVRLPLPEANARQEVLWVYPQPGYERIVDDEFGNRIALYADKDMAPGEVRRHGWMAAVRTFAAVWEPSADVAPLGQEDRARYLEDRPNYQMTSPVIAALRDSLTRAEMKDAEKVAAVFNYLVENFKYVRDDKWDPAPEVLQRKTGSCSEYTFSFIAMMRACGIPCRYTGGLVLNGERKTKYDEKIHEDAVFHRWAEVYLKDYGWFPVDGSRAGGDVRRFGNYLNDYGRLPSGVLQLYSGDGGEDSYVGWDYTSYAKGAGKGSVGADAVCYWIEAPADQLKPAVEEVEAALAAKMPAEKLAALTKNLLSREVLFLLADRLDRARLANLVEELRAAHHPAAVYFAVYADKLGVALPSFLTFPNLVDEGLRGEIMKHRKGGAWNWSSFEHWWRKARTETTFAEPRQAFILNAKTLDLN
jgi:transglutaminase-like putative cysteine protease